MKTILLVEPDYVLAKIYKQAIEADAMSVVTTVSGAQAAVIAADQQKPDLVILELQLIEHSGMEFLYEFRSYPEWQAIPIILQTIVPFGEFHDNWHLLQDELGISAYLYKPHTSLHQLLSSVKEHSLVAA